MLRRHFRTGLLLNLNTPTAIRRWFFILQSMKIMPLLPMHAPEVLEIYRQGIDSGIATFETEVPDWEQFNAKFLLHSRLAAMEDSHVIGWATLAPVSARECYSGVAEISIYIHQGHRGKGVGKELLKHLIIQSERHGIWSLLSVMHEENTASVQLHTQMGFRLIGYRERIARLHGQWKTTVMMERRSKVTGT